jgi:RimJ/RimL family protein N-acetyltransferase
MHRTERIVMPQAAKYSANEELRDGRLVEIRALRPEDREAFLAAVEGIGAESLRRRFFGAKRSFAEPEIVYFVNVDFVAHVALVAVVKDGVRSTIVGGARYIIVQPGKAEIAFAIVDRYQGQGLGAALMRHLVTIARGAELREFVAEMLAENTSMLKVFAKSGLPLTTKRRPGTVEITLQLS